MQDSIDRFFNQSPLNFSNKSENIPSTSQIQHEFDDQSELNDFFEKSPEQELDGFEEINSFFHESHQSLVSVVNDIQNKSMQVYPCPQTKKIKKPKKNSNTIKKIGRIILNHLEKFNLKNNPNEGVQRMLQLLDKRSKDKQNLKDFRDGFNTSHLEALFNTASEITTFNLKVARQLFAKNLRKQVFNSFQIKAENKLLYLNSLKCSTLRFCHKKLALRLQLSENP